MRIGLLGALRVEDGPDAPVLGAAKERSLLSVLALSPGSVVSTKSLIAALWGDDAPAAARKTLQTYVWNLRQALGADAIVTEPPGYALAVAPEDVDVSRFRSLVRDGDAAVRRGASEDARASFEAAVALWRGDPFPGVAAHTGLAAEAVRLKEEYLSAVEARLAADLAVGRHDDVIGELEALVREHPFRERLWGHLMVALYRAGRQADALATYQRAREVLVNELGLEPGGELRRVEALILDQDPVLSAPERPPVTASDAIVRSPVRYARCAGGGSVAYQVAGSGPVDILVVAGFVSHLDIWWNAPTDRLVRRLTAMGRMISFDKRGMGLSDRPEQVGLDEWLEDALTVLDAVGSERAIVLGVSAGGLTAIRLAALHPERVEALALHGAFARQLSAPDYDVGHERSLVEDFVENLVGHWGTGVAIEFYAPSRADDPFVRDYWARYQLLSASPEAAERFLWASIEPDVRDLLPTIRVPTLVIAADRDVIVPVGQSRYIADHIEGAEFVGLDSDVHLICVSDVIDELTDAIEGFINRVVPAAGADPVVLTVLAVAGVSPTARADVEAVLARCGGEVHRGADTATFDSPLGALRCARTLTKELSLSEPDLRIGLHSGQCVVADDGPRGRAVDVARRLVSHANSGETLATQTLRDVVSDGSTEFAARGTLPDPYLAREWDIFTVDASSRDLRRAGPDRVSPRG